MRPSVLAILLFAALSSPALAQAQPQTHADAILQRLDDANHWRDHVMVVAHRGGWKENGRITMPENSIQGVEASIALGVEMVELDVRASKDGELVVMHDSWLDRTTTCRGEVIEFTVAELKTCHLVVEGTGRVTEETVPTLRDMLAVTKGRVLVNIDNKLGPDSIAAIAIVARGMGVANQIVLKENVWNAARLADIRDTIDAAGSDFHFMPIIADDAVSDPSFVETVARTFGADAIEMIHWRGDATAPTPAGGALFTARTRAVAARGNWHLWVDTYPIVNKPAGFLSGGRGDELAVAASLPGEVFGFWVDRGATIIQTDEPKAAIAWLAANGWRVPYAAPPPDSTASID